MVVIRLSRHGRKNFPFYKIVVADSRRSVKKKFIERIGFFDPFSTKKKGMVNIKLDRLAYWKKQGAKLSERIKNLVIKLNK